MYRAIALKYPEFYDVFQSFHTSHPRGYSLVSHRPDGEAREGALGHEVNALAQEGTLGYEVNALAQRGYPGVRGECACAERVPWGTR